ncbi:hypothetical protein Q1695_016001 [Nippostrongylus brasiliensis]|nr:hypothetical protein Q1695_016001 [Nippostrongylus brasiliensis]
MMVWLSGLAAKLSNKEFADEMKAGLCGIEHCVDELAATITGDIPSQSFHEKVWRHVPDLLFPRHDWAELTRRLMPLMINHFTSIRCMKVVEANTCRRDPLEQGDFFDHILSKRSGRLEKRRLTADAMLNTITYMIEGRFKLNDLIIAVVHATFVKVGKAYIEHVLERTGGITIEQMEEIYDVLSDWLNTIPLTDKDDLRTIEDLGRNVLRKAIIDRLTDSIYDMAVVNFPKSYPTLSTLRKCMINVQEYGRENLVRTLISDVESKLLNIAVDTPAILNGYSLCVESLRELDPSCVIMHRVCKVIKEYLKRRPDTVRQIINYITSEKRDDLAAHLANRCGTIVDEDELTGANDEFLPEAMSLSQWRHWAPDPIDVSPGESGRFRQAADVFNMLVSVYGSKEMFVKEYRQLLAERLTSSNTKDPIFERRYLDLLKLRFNEGELQQCEVMLKDIRESQRIDRTALGRKCIPVSACVISSHFWPKVVSETVAEFPPALEEALIEYEKSFMDHKESRRLQWLRAVGRRPDTVRQIINYITSEKRDDLAAHLANRCGTIVDEDELTGANDEFLPEAMSLSQWRHWAPDPIDVSPGESGRFRQAADVFNMLVSVYGSKEMFVKEYRQLLAERLTSSNTKDPIFERRYLDLLKLRFNEGELQQCEVMLKDIRESQRIDRTALGRKCIPVSACVISSHFWPKVVSETVAEFPPALEEALIEYEKSFMDHKESRRLQWLRAVGCVEVTLKLDDVEVDKVVPNPIAAVLYLYLEKESWTITEVAERLSISKGVARRRLEWWRSQGLLTQNIPTGATVEEWSLVTNPSLLATSKGAADEESDEDEGAIEETTDAIDALEQYWSYTKNFIANHDNGEVKAERMHRIYRMFSSPSAQGPSLETVTAFLMRKVKLNLLTYNNGFFRIVKESGNKTG